MAVGVGITLASLLYAKRVADRAKLVKRKIYGDDTMRIEKVLEKTSRHKIRVVHISGAFFFGSATQIISQFDEFLGTKYLIIVYDGEDMLDISAIFALEDIILRLKSQHIKILMVMNNEDVKSQLEKYDIVSQVEGVYSSEFEAIDVAKSSYK